jgi:hypothetical protein
MNFPAVWLVELDVQTISTGAVETLRVSTEGFQDDAGLVYEPLLSGDPVFGQRVAVLDGQPAVPELKLTLSGMQPASTPASRFVGQDVDAAGQSCRLRLGALGPRRAVVIDPDFYFEGTVNVVQLAGDSEVITITVVGQEALADVPALAQHLGLGRGIRLESLLYATAPDDSALTPNLGFLVETVARRDPGFVETGVVLVKGIAGTAEYSIVITGAGNVQGRMWEGGAPVLVSDTAVCDGWTHIGLMWSGSILKLFVNGQKVDEQPLASPQAPVGGLLLGTGLTIDRPLDGEIAWIRFKTGTTVLPSDAEIAAGAFRPLADNTGWTEYLMQEGTGNTSYNAVDPTVAPITLDDGASQWRYLGTGSPSMAGTDEPRAVGEVEVAPAVIADPAFNAVHLAPQLAGLSHVAQGGSKMRIGGVGNFGPSTASSRPPNGLLTVDPVSTYPPPFARFQAGWSVELTMAGAPLNDGTYTVVGIEDRGYTMEVSPDFTTAASPATGTIQVPAAESEVTVDLVTGVATFETAAGASTLPQNGEVISWGGYGTAGGGHLAEVVAEELSRAGLTLNAGSDAALRARFPEGDVGYFIAQQQSSYEVITALVGSAGPGASWGIPWGSDEVVVNVLNVDPLPTPEHVFTDGNTVELRLSDQTEAIDDVRLDHGSNFRQHADSEVLATVALLDPDFTELLKSPSRRATATGVDGATILTHRSYFVRAAAAQSAATATFAVAGVKRQLWTVASTVGDLFAVLGQTAVAVVPPSSGPATEIAGVVVGVDCRGGQLAVLTVLA